MTMTIKSALKFLLAVTQLKWKIVNFQDLITFKGQLEFTYDSVCRNIFEIL